MDGGFEPATPTSRT